SRARTGARRAPGWTRRTRGRAAGWPRPARRAGGVEAARSLGSRTSPRGRGCGSTGLLRAARIGGGAQCVFDVGTGVEPRIMNRLGSVHGFGFEGTGALDLDGLPHPLQGGLGLLGACAEQRQLAAPARDAGVAPLLAVGAPGAGSRGAVLAAVAAVVALEALRAGLGGGQGAHRVSFRWRRSSSVSARIASVRALTSAALRLYSAARSQSLRADSQLRRARSRFSIVTRWLRRTSRAA